ncbi:hypothetical protein [Caldimonas brevitalea]|uniref:Uncharacterized protein n=1 Tax=Caldimonas brevitalea TaxID=413882 RepID=A0A0G3BMX9_9BURK|nr:hypothetical protein [Caldimonas brevitalea]AKJ28756.1 hypothetical protein AAW51_2065 [Caldimonas brevitalea]
MTEGGSMHGTPSAAQLAHAVELLRQIQERALNLGFDGVKEALEALERHTASATQFSLNELANKVAREIPEGWWIDIGIEQGYCGVSLYNPDGFGVAEEFAVDGTLEDAVNAALQYAKERA